MHSTATQVPLIQNRLPGWEEKVIEPVMITHMLSAKDRVSTSNVISLFVLLLALAMLVLFEREVLSVWQNLGRAFQA
jgi:hypothetical protein